MPRKRSLSRGHHVGREVVVADEDVPLLHLDVPAVRVRAVGEVEPERS
jgi:hypothetical protein